MNGVGNVGCLQDEEGKVEHHLRRKHRTQQGVAENEGCGLAHLNERMARRRLRPDWLTHAG